MANEIEFLLMLADLQNYRIEALEKENKKLQKQLEKCKKKSSKA